MGITEKLHIGLSSKFYEEDFLKYYLQSLLFTVFNTHLALFGQCMYEIICPRVVHVWHKNGCIFRNACLRILVNWNLKIRGIHPLN